MIWNVLEDLRRAREPRARLRRGADAAASTTRSSGSPRATGRSTARTCSSSSPENRAVRAEADELPGPHASLFADGACSYRELPLRIAEAGVAAPRRARRRAARPAARAAVLPGRRAHLLHAASRSRTRCSAASSSATRSTTCSGSRSRSSSRRGPRTSSAPTRSGTSPRPRSRRRSSGAGSSTRVNAGDGAFYGPKIDLHMLDSLGRAWQIGTIQLDFQMPQRFGLRYMGADNAEHTPVMIHRALIGSFERFIGILIEHFAGAFPFWLAPGAGAGAPGRARPPRRRRRRSRRGSPAYRVEVDDSDETVGKRIRNAELDKIPFVVVYGDKESRRRRSRSASTAAASRRSRWPELLGAACYAFVPDKQGRNRLSPPGRASSAASGVQPKWLRTVPAAACQRFSDRSSTTGRNTRAWYVDI